MNKSKKIQSVKKDFEKAIVRLNKIFQDYVEMKGRTKHLIEALFNLENEFVNVFLKWQR